MRFCLAVCCRGSSARARANHAGNVFGAAAPTSLLAAAIQERLERGAVADVQHARAFGPIDFGATNGEKIDAEARYMQIEVAGRLHRHRYAGRLAELHSPLGAVCPGLGDRRFGDVCNVGWMVPISLLAIMTAHDYRVVLDGGGNRPSFDDARFGFHWHATVAVCPLIFNGSHSPWNSISSSSMAVVTHVASWRVRPQYALDSRQIVALGTAASEHDFGGFGTKGY